MYIAHKEIFVMLTNINIYIHSKYVLRYILSLKDSELWHHLCYIYLSIELKSNVVCFEQSFRVSAHS